MRQTAGLSGQTTTSWICVWKTINHPVSGRSAVAAADKPAATALQPVTGWSSSRCDAAENDRPTERRSTQYHAAAVYIPNKPRHCGSTRQRFTADECRRRRRRPTDGARPECFSSHLTTPSSHLAYTTTAWKSDNKSFDWLESLSFIDELIKITLQLCSRRSQKHALRKPNAADSVLGCLLHNSEWWQIGKRLQLVAWTSCRLVHKSTAYSYLGWPKLDPRIKSIESSYLYNYTQC